MILGTRVEYDGVVFHSEDGAVTHVAIDVAHQPSMAYDSGLDGPPGIERGVVGLLAPPGSSEIGAPDDGWFVEAVKGWRTWNVHALNGEVTLYALYSSFPWERDRPTQAACRCGEWAGARLRPEGDRVHTCGLHAWNRSVKVAGPGIVAGEVWLWGGLAIHEFGYRARFAQIAALHVYDGMAPRDRTVIELAALQYGVPVVRVDW